MTRLAIVAAVHVVLQWRFWWLARRAATYQFRAKRSSDPRCS